jgi:predicted MFS family arabinose efflux permease
MRASSAPSSVGGSSRRQKWSPYPTVVPTTTGSAYITGIQRFVLDPRTRPLLSFIWARRAYCGALDSNKEHGLSVQNRKCGMGMQVGERKGVQLLLLFLVRTVINTAFRIIYPFLPSMARGLGISLTAASRLVTLRMVAGMGAPFLGPLADRHGRRRIMEIALLLFTLASLVLAGLGTFTAAAVAFTLYGLSKALYYPAVHAYVGDAVPYDKRGRAVGVIELSWSAAWLLGVPASGFLIERFGWRAPWAVLIALGLLGTWLTQVGLPPTCRSTTHDDSKPFVASMIATWRSLLHRRAVVCLLLTSFLQILAIEIPFIVYGAWLEAAFGLSLTTLGLASTVVGLADATAELGTTVITDRLGKRRSVLVGLLGLTVSLVALPWISRLGLAAALAGVALMLLTFEFGVVSLLPLVTEVAADARASLTSLNLTASSLSRILAALIGGWLWRWQSIALHAGLGAACALTAAFLFVYGMSGSDL